MKLTDTIEEAFSAVERPDDGDYTDSKGGEAHEESAKFFGLARQQLTPDFLENYRGVLYWFTPAAFHYYLPAFLKAAVETDDEDALYVHSVLFLLRSQEKESFSKARWSQLDDEQISALRKWLEWLLDKAHDDEILAGEAREAIEVLDARLWW